jgi:hypothetical protein
MGERVDKDISKGVTYDVIPSDSSYLGDKADPISNKLEGLG